MKKKVIAALLITIMVSAIVVAVIFAAMGSNHRNPLSDLFRFEYNTDIQMVFNNSEEQEAINKSMFLPYEDLLGQTRYDENRNLSEKKTRIHFMDKVVEEDGRKYINTKRSNFESGSYSFEFKVNCRFFDNITIYQKKARNSDGYIIEIGDPELPLIDSFWADYPPYSGFLRNNTPDIDFPDQGFIYHDGFIVDGIENATGSYCLNEVFLVVMLAEIESSHRGGLGNGNGVHQYVIMDEDLEPILIIADKFEWDS